jgi:hypothetical protein
MAKQLEGGCAPATAAAPGAMNISQAGATNTVSQTGPTVTQTGLTINVTISPDFGSAAAAAAAASRSAPPKTSTKIRTPSGFVQASLPVSFGRLVRSFEGMSNLDILKELKWMPVESGGFSCNSAISRFHNTFMADYACKNPTAMFDSETERLIKKKSFEAYQEMRKSVSCSGMDDQEDLVSGIMGADGVLDVDQVGSAARMVLVWTGSVCTILAKTQMMLLKSACAKR